MKNPVLPDDFQPDSFEIALTVGYAAKSRPNISQF
jgi:hypothetical protein